MFLTNRKKYRQNITKKNAEEEEEMRKGRKKKHRNKNYSNKSVQYQCVVCHRPSIPGFPIAVDHRFTRSIFGRIGRGDRLTVFAPIDALIDASIHPCATNLKFLHRCCRKRMLCLIVSHRWPRGHVHSYTHTYTHSLFLSPYSSYSLVLVQSLVPRNHCPRPVLE